MIRIDVRRKGNSTSDNTVDQKHVSTIIHWMISSDRLCIWRIEPKEGS